MVTRGTRSGAPDHYVVTRGLALLHLVREDMAVTRTLIIIITPNDNDGDNLKIMLQRYANLPSSLQVFLYIE